MLLRERQEFKTILLITLCYALWWFLLFGPIALPFWLTILLLVPVITFHSSLQHECIHGHPFVDRRLNDLIVYLPIGLFMPYSRFKEIHLTHHQRARITDPTEDPESWYVTRQQWKKYNRAQKLVWKTNNILIGRMLIGPTLGISTLVRSDIQKIQNGERQILSAWAKHIFLCSLILICVGYFANISVLGYFIVAYFGMSLLMIRTFLEHQAHPDRRARSVLIDDKGPLRFLFLNNNLHAVHHAFPSVAWYRLPSLFRLHNPRFMEMNKGYFYNSYTEVIRAHAFTRKEPVAFPLDTV